MNPSITQQLNEKTALDALTGATSQSVDLTAGGYDRKSLRPGIVHFGVGNFHRCHQAVYVDALLRLGHRDWGIAGVSMRSPTIRDQLAPQDFLYTEVTLGQSCKFRFIGSILNILVAPENPTAVINQVADDSIKLVTTTITEKGYCLSSGHIDRKHPDLLADEKTLQEPATIYGYLAAALIQRCNNGGAPLTVLCCDNIQSGGAHLKAGVRILLKQHDEDVMSWADKHVSFASSMVDRVSPATSDSLRQLVRTSLTLADAWPVSGEPYSQWVIEDNFAGQRPPFDEVGAVFTDNIALFEQMKLRFLNAGHSIISVLGYLASEKTVHQTLEHNCIHDFTLGALHENVLSVAKLPPNCSGEDYIAEVFARFGNSALPYNVQQVNTDSSQKIQQRWFPTVDDALAQNADTQFLSFILAAWVLYVQKALDSDELHDPLRADFLTAQTVTAQRVTPEFAEQEQEQAKDCILSFLRIAGADSFSFFSSESFMTAVSKNYQRMQSTDINTAIDEFLSHREASIHA